MTHTGCLIEAILPLTSPPVSLRLISLSHLLEFRSSLTALRGYGTSSPSSPPDVSLLLSKLKPLCTKKEKSLLNQLDSLYTLRQLLPLLTRMQGGGDVDALLRELPKEWREQWELIQLLFSMESEKETAQ